MLFDLGFAAVEALSSNTVLVRFAAGSSLTHQDIVQLIDAIAEWPADKPIGVVALVPELNFEVRVMYTEYAFGRNTERLKALAVVATSGFMGQLIDVYFRNYMLDRCVRRFQNVELALEWVDEHAVLPRVPVHSAALGLSWPQAARTAVLQQRERNAGRRFLGSS